MLPKSHLTLYYKMSGSRWAITPSWLSRSLRSFSVHSSSVHCCHLFSISFASVRSILILSFILSFIAWNLPLASQISLTRLLVFPILLFSFISLHHSLRKAFLSLLSLLWTLHADGYIFPFLLCLLLLFFSHLFVWPPQAAILSTALIFLGDGFDHRLLYNVINIHP